MHTKEKEYLKWYNKIGYGSGDIAGNVVYALLSAFVMIFLTDTVGMNAGIVGTLIAVSKLFDGVSDIFFGSLIDKTNTKMGKARPWMLYGYFGCAVCLVAIFCIPADISATAQYAWFFIAYTLLNAGFYTANNIAYSALTALVTKNNHERFHVRVRHQHADPDHHSRTGRLLWRRSGCMADRGYHLRHCRCDLQHAFRPFGQRIDARRTRGRG